MQIFKWVMVGAAMAAVGITSNEAFAARKTRVQLTCEQIQKNGQNGTLENTLPPYSEHFYIVAKFNSCLNTLITPPYTYLRTSGTGSGLISRNKEGTQVVLAQFPASGSTLAAFGLTTSAIKSIAIPNDLQEWPTSALSGCTDLERITSFGEEADTGVLALTAQHFTDCANLKHIQPPSTVDTLDTGSILLKIQTIVFPRNVRSISGFGGYAALTSADFSRCTKLSEVPTYLFYACSNLPSVNFANCSVLPFLEEGFFYRCNHLVSVDLSGCRQMTTLRNHCLGCAQKDGSHLTTVILPPSVIAIHNYALSLFGGANDVLPNLRTIIWKGRSSRPATIAEGNPTNGVSSRACGDSKTLDELVQANVIQEIFVP